MAVFGSVQSFLESQHARLNGYAYEVQTYDPFGGILCHVTKADVQNPEASSPRVRVHYRTDHYSYRLIRISQSMFHIVPTCYITCPDSRVAEGVVSSRFVYSEVLDVKFDSRHQYLSWPYSYLTIRWRS